MATATMRCPHCGDNTIVFKVAVDPGSPHDYWYGGGSGPEIVDSEFAEQTCDEGCPDLTEEEKTVLQDEITFDTLDEDWDHPHYDGA